MKVLVAGGGTGGHVVPALVVCELLKKRGAELLYVGSTAPIDRRLVEEAGVPFRAISTGKLRRYFSWRNFTDPFRVMVGFLQSLRIIRRYRPDVVFGKGGFVTVPVIKAARFLKVPVVLHESDAVVGLSNRIGAKAAAKIAVSFPASLMKDLPADKMVFTGNPISRKVITGKPERARRTFKLSTETPIVLVVGGSSGSTFINGLVQETLGELLSEAVVVHQVGEASAKEIAAYQQTLSPEARERYVVRGYFSDKDLFDLYAAADVIVGRAGAGVIGGIAAVGKPAVLIPLPKAVSAAQRANASYLSGQGAAVVLPQEKVTSEELLRVVRKLLHDPQRRAEMGRAIRKLSTLEAGEKVADLVWEVGQTRG